MGEVAIVLMLQELNMVVGALQNKSVTHCSCHGGQKMMTTRILAIKCGEDIVD